MNDKQGHNIYKQFNEPIGKTGKNDKNSCAIFR